MVCPFTLAKEYAYSKSDDAGVEAAIAAIAGVNAFLDGMVYFVVAVFVMFLAYATVGRNETVRRKTELVRRVLARLCSSSKDKTGKHLVAGNAHMFCFTTRRRQCCSCLRRRKRKCKHNTGDDIGWYGRGGGGEGKAKEHESATVTNDAGSSGEGSVELVTGQTHHQNPLSAGETADIGGGARKAWSSDPGDKCTEEKTAEVGHAEDDTEDGAKTEEYDGPSSTAAPADAPQKRLPFWQRGKLRGRRVAGPEKTNPLPDSKMFGMQNPSYNPSLSSSDVDVVVSTISGGGGEALMAELPADAEGKGGNEHESGIAHHADVHQAMHVPSLNCAPSADEVSIRASIHQVRNQLAVVRQARVIKGKGVKVRRRAAPSKLALSPKPAPHPKPAVPPKPARLRVSGSDTIRHSDDEELDNTGTATESLVDATSKPVPPPKPTLLPKPILPPRSDAPHHSDDTSDEIFMDLHHNNDETVTSAESVVGAEDEDEEKTDSTLQGPSQDTSEITESFISADEEEAENLQEQKMAGNDMQEVTSRTADIDAESWV